MRERKVCGTGWRWWVAVVTCAVWLPMPLRAAVPSLPGDANCDGIVSPADIGQLAAELADGDGPAVADIDGGTVVSCAGADANGDGSVSAADLLSLSRRVAGEDDAIGPVITFLGIASAGGATTSPVGDDPLRVYQVVSGIGFRLVVEAAPGRSGLPVGQEVFRSNPVDPAQRPDLQVLVSADLGNGNPAICGEGGVPGVAPPSFDPRQEIADALNDLSCRFGVAANPAVSCTLDRFGSQQFVDPRTRLQFCLSVSSVEAFPAGGALISARALDMAGNPGPVAQILLAVGDQPLPTLTARPTATSAASPTSSATRTSSPTAAATTTPTTGATVPTATASATALPTRTASPSPTGPGSPTPTASRTATRTPVPPTATATRTASRTATHTAGPSPTASHTPPETQTRTRTATRTVTRSATRTASSTATASRTPLRTATASATATRTRTRTPTGVASPTRTGSATPTPAASETRTATRTASATRSATRTATAPRTPTATRTSTAPPATPSETPTWTLPPTRTRTATATGTRTATATRTSTLRPGTPSETPTWTRPPTRTQTATRSGTRTATATRTITPTRTASGTATFTQTRTATPTDTVTATPPATSTVTMTRTHTATRSPTQTLSPTVTRTPSLTRTPSATPTVTRTATASRTGTPTATPSLTRTGTATRTATRTATETRTPTITLTPSITPTPSITRTPTATPRPGADVTFVGLARPNDVVLQPVGTTPEGWPIYERPFGFLFTVVVEAKPGPSRRNVGLNAFRHSPFDPSVRPDLEVIVSRPLGDGSALVCDDMLPFIGGVPASNGFDFTQPISDAINDFACRFLNGDGDPGGRGPGLACTIFTDGEFRFVAAGSTAQFCAGIAEPFGFAIGDTVVTVRVRDVTGQPGPPASMVVRVLP